MGTASYPATQLMQLRQAEPLGLLHHHDRRVRDVHADFDHRRCNKDLALPGLEGAHRRLLFAGAQFAMQKSDGYIGENVLAKLREHLLRRLDRCCFGLLYDWIDDIGLTSLLDFLRNEAVHAFYRALGNTSGYHRLAVGRQFVYGRDVQVPVDSKRECSGNRGCRHHEYIRLLAFLEQLPALANAEAVLFIYDREAEPGECNVFL